MKYLVKTPRSKFPNGISVSKKMFESNIEVAHLRGHETTIEENGGVKTLIIHPKK